MTRALSLIAALALCPWPALAWTGTVDWPTFYRTGPATQYGVLDEVQRGQMFEVLSCDGDWCKVQDSTSVGYIERDALIEGLPAAMPAKPGECFVTRSAGHNLRGQPFRTCARPGG